MGENDSLAIQIKVNQKEDYPEYPALLTPSFFPRPTVCDYSSCQNLPSPWLLLPTSATYGGSSAPAALTAQTSPGHSSHRT